MTAHATAETLSSYLDGELASPDRAAVERHIAACPGCRGRLDSLRRVVDNLRRIERAAPPPTLAQHVQRRVALEGDGGSLVARLEERMRRLPVASSLGTSFAVVLALAAILYLYAHGLDRRGDRSVPVVVPSREAAREFAAANAHRDPASVRLDGVVFVLEGGRWVEGGLVGPLATGAVAVAETVDPASEAGTAGLAGRPELAARLAGGEAAVVRDGDRAVELRPPATSP
jgi:anti-sigma factor RsiW